MPLVLGNGRSAIGGRSAGIEHRGAALRFDTGGAAPAVAASSPASGATPPAYLGATPMVQGLYQKFVSLPLDKLQELAVRMPPTSMYGQMIRRALHAKQMAPAATGAFPTAAAIGAPQGFPAAASAQARGGGIPRRDSGGGTPFSIIQGRGDTGAPPGTPSFAPPSGYAPGQAGVGSAPPVWLTDPMGRGILPPGLRPTPIGGAPSGSPRAPSPPSSPTPPSTPLATNLPSSLTDGSWARSLRSLFGGYAFPSFGGFYGGHGGFPFVGGSYGGTSFARAPTGQALPMLSFSAGNPGQVGPTWAPGQPLLDASSVPTTTPPGFGSPATPPLVTPLPASVLSPAPAASAASSSSSFPGLSPAQSAQLAQAVNSGQLAWNGRAYVDPTNPLAMNPDSNFARGGEIPHGAHGGFDAAPLPERAASVALRRAAAELYHPGGFLESAVAGRTDQLPLAIAADSHVIPADVVSGIGEGNSLNGAHLLDQMFHSGPWGVRAAKARAPSVMPRPPHAFAAGSRLTAGSAPERTTSILAAGGEYVVRPEAVEHFGEIAKRRNLKRFARKSAMEAGHDAIDDFIVRARKHIVATTMRLPGPVKE